MMNVCGRLALLLAGAGTVAGLLAPTANAATRPETPSPHPAACPSPSTLTAPGAPLPDLLCPQSGGQDPNSPYQQARRHDAQTKGCGFIDVGCKTREAVTGWFRDLVKSATDPVFQLLGATVFGTPDIDSSEMSRARELWGTSQVIANSCFALVISIAAILLMAGQSLPTQLSLKDLLPRVLLAFLAANLSLILIGYGISFANGLASAFLATGRSHVQPEEVGKMLAGGISATIATNGIFYILVGLVAVVLAAMVAFIYVVRLAVTMVLVSAAPLALMLHALPMTEGLARLWWRGITGMLAIQICQSLVFVTALQLLFTRANGNDTSFWGIPADQAQLIDLLLVICLLYVMIRIPSWVARTIWQPVQPRMLSSLVQSLVVYRTIGAVTGSIGKAARAARPGGGGPHPGGGHQRPGPGRTGPSGGAGGRPDNGGAGSGPRRPDGGPRRSPGDAGPAPDQHGQRRHPPNERNHRDRPDSTPTEAGHAGPAATGLRRVPDQRIREAINRARPAPLASSRNRLQVRSRPAVATRPPALRLDRARRAAGGAR